MIAVAVYGGGRTLPFRLVGARANTEAVRAFVRDDYGKVLGAVAMAVGSRDLAEDAVQDALVKVLRDDHHPDNMAAWVTVVAINEARRVLRRRGAESRAYDRSPPAVQPDPFHEVEMGGALRVAVSALPDRQRDAVLLHYYLDTSVADTAAALGVDDGTVKTHLHRARSALAEVIGEEDPR